MVVVGNKCDMKKRVVSKQEGKTLADEFGAGFLEISVSTLTQHIILPFETKQTNLYILLVHSACGAGEGEPEGEGRVPDAGAEDPAQEPQGRRRRGRCGGRLRWRKGRHVSAHSCCVMGLMCSTPRKRVPSTPRYRLSNVFPQYSLLTSLQFRRR